MDLIPFLEEKLGQISAVLPRNACDKSAFRQRIPFPLFAVLESSDPRSAVQVLTFQSLYSKKPRTNQGEEICLRERKRLFLGFEVFQVAQDKTSPSSDEFNVLQASNRQETTEDELRMKGHSIEALTGDQQFFIPHGRGHDGFPHVVSIPILCFQPTLFPTFLKKRSSGIRNDDGGLEGFRISLAHEKLSELDGLVDIPEILPRITEHHRQVWLQSGLRGVGARAHHGSSIVAFL